MLSIREPQTELTPAATVRRLGPRDLRLAAVVGAVLGTAYLALFLRSVFFESYEEWIAYLMAPGLFLAAAPFLRRMLRTVEPDAWIRTVVVCGLAAKLLGAFARFYTNELVLGRGDSLVYHFHGTALAGQFRSFIFSGSIVEDSLPDLSGTPFIRLLTGLLYTVTGPTRLGGFVAFSFLSFWGLYLFYRAHRIALPNALGRRYAVLLFFLPSMVFWPSSIGKEAWMTTMLGLGTYGAARVLTHQRWGYLAAVSALAGMTMVRPHVAALFFVGFAAALSTRRSDSPTGQVKKVFGLMLLAGLSILLMRQLQAFFNLDSLDAQDVFERTTDRSAQGGSAFEASQPTSIGGLPWAFVTVLFRPFLFEVGGSTGIISAAEGSVLLGLFLWHLRSVGRAARSLLSQPFITMVVVYTFLFVIAFSAVSNFGILARQRTQLYPLAMVMLTIPRPAATACDRKVIDLRLPASSHPTDRRSVGPPVTPSTSGAMARSKTLDDLPTATSLRQVDPAGASVPSGSFAPVRHAESNRYRTVLVLIGLAGIVGLTSLAWISRSSDDNVGPVSTFERLIPTAVSSLTTTTTAAPTTAAPPISNTTSTSARLSTTSPPTDSSTVSTTQPPPTTRPPATRPPATRPPATTAPPTTVAPTTPPPPTIPDITFPPPTVLPPTAAP